MAEARFPVEDIDSAQNLFDVFLLIFAWLKEREGELLSLNPTRTPGFERARAEFSRLLAELSAADPEFADLGELSPEARQRIKNVVGLAQEDTAAAWLYGAMVAIDESRPHWTKPRLKPLNRSFTDRGTVRFLPQSCLPYGESRRIRGYGETGTRIENRLRNLTVCSTRGTGYSVRVVKVNDAVLNQFAGGRSPTFALAPFRAADDPPDLRKTQDVGEEGVFLAAAARDHPDASRRLKVILEAAVRHAADILVFPELSFTSGLLSQLQSELEARSDAEHVVKLVVAGTLRTPEDRNVCNILGPDGRVLWQQPKMNRFVVRPGDLGDAAEGIGGQRATEDIDISDRAIRVADFPFGRLAVLVCLDFILPETYAALSSLRANCIIVPSMSPSSGRFDTLAWAHAAASGATTLFCNAPNSPGFKAEACSFAYAPIEPAKTQPIGDAQPWERHMLIFASEPFRCDTVKLFKTGGPA